MRLGPGPGPRPDSRTELPNYLDGLWQVFDGQVKPDAELQREDVLPLRSLLSSTRNELKKNPSKYKESKNKSKSRDGVIAVPVSPVLANTPEVLGRSGAQFLLLLFLLLAQDLVLETHDRNGCLTSCFLIGFQCFC